MTGLSRRHCMMGAAAAGLAALDQAWAANTPRHEVKHGRGHIVHHHTYFETAGAEPDSLNGIAKSRGLAFGSCLGVRLNKKAVPPPNKPAPTKPPVKPVLAKTVAPPPAAPVKSAPPSELDDQQLRALFISQCGILVPENELKWYALRKTPGKFDFERADALLAFGTEHRLPVRGHNLLWNRSRWLPEWVNSHDFGTNPVPAAEKMLRDHIKTVCHRYGDRIFSYDVVNETISPFTGEMEDSPFTKALGPDVVDIAFRAAREAAPHAELVYNDYMSWSPKDALHRAGVLKLLERLKKNNVPIDALGIQAHIGGNGMGMAGGQLRDADVVEWRKFLDAVTGMGIGLVITEFDVNDKYVPGTIAERDRTVADYAKAFLDLTLSYPQLRYVMAWGLVDKYSWLQRSTRPDGLPKRCTPYDDAYQPKPLRAAMAQAFAAAPVRPAMPMKSA